MKIVMVGGTADYPGGVEAFCERAVIALSEYEGVHATVVPANTSYLSVRRLPKFASSLVALLKARKTGPDAVWLQYVTIFDLAFLVLSRALRLPVMVTPHLGAAWRSQKSPLLRQLSCQVLKLADRLALISATQELEIGLPARVPRSLVRNYLPRELLSTAVPKPNPVGSPLQLVHAGRLSPGKGTMDFVHVCGELRKRHIPFQATLVGSIDNEFLSQVQTEIARLGLADALTYRGRLDWHDLFEVYRRADVLLHLSRVDSYPLVVLETLSLGCFPVCLELAGARDMVVTFAGHTVSPDQPVAAAADYLASVDVQAIRREAREAADAVRLEYGWQHAAGRASSALAECFERRDA